MGKCPAQFPALKEGSTMENCVCQIDWILCKELDCPRVAWVRALQSAAEQNGRELLDLDECDDGHSDNDL
jgi:hypothetical protein